MKLERYAHELSDVVAGQQRQIDALLLETRRLRERSSEERKVGSGECVDERFPDVRDVLADLVDEFINAFLAVNPR